MPKAKKVTGACTEAEAKDFKKFLDDAIAANNVNFPMPEWAAVVSPSCASCVFSKEDDPEWGVVITKAADPESFLTYNRGGCIEVASNSEGCGRSYQHFQGCPPIVCAQCKLTEDDGACVSDAFVEQTCAPATVAVKTECGADITSYEAACTGGLEAFIRAQCIAPKAIEIDGG